MNKISVSNEKPENFARKVQRALKKGPLGKVCEFFFNENQFCIIFNQMGTSKIFFEIERREEGFVAHKKQEEILLLHQFFRSEVEKELKKIILHFGGVVE